MIPMRTSSIFKSRWMALLWAAGFIWLALDVAGSNTAPANSSTNQSAAQNGASDEDVQTAANALGL
jgi:hypothetical protein